LKRDPYTLERPTRTSNLPIVLSFLRKYWR